jgi:hypothetical protein
MDLEAFRLVREHYDDFRRPTRFRNPAFDLDALVIAPEGQSTVFVGHLLNYAVSLLEPNEAHLTIGVLTGRSLAYTIHGHADKIHYACDNFCWGPGVRERFLAWLWESTNMGIVRFVEMDATEFLRHRPPLIRHPIGVYFYDADHSYEYTLESLRLAEPFLARQAVIVLDDTNLGEVRRAAGDWLRTTPGTSLVFDLPTPGNCHPTWWNGLWVLGYQR